jgi:transposase
MDNQGRSKMDARQERGRIIAETCKIERQATALGSIWYVPSSTKGKYVVRLNHDNPTCTCPDWELREMKCKHIFAVEFSLKQQQNADGSTTTTKTVTVVETVKRPTYKQVWPAYNAAQTNEKDKFQMLLADLRRGIKDETPRTKGQPRLLLSDAIFAAVFKVYSTVSGRRFTSDLRESQKRGHITKAPHYNSIFNYLENPAVGDILRTLILEAARPLKSVELDFACDSSGFMSSRFARWYDHKYGGIKQEHEWVKVHIVCGVKTNVVTAVEILDRHAHDSPLMPTLIDTTARDFTMREVSADMGYSAGSNHDAALKHGATPFIAFKSNATGSVGGLFEKMYHYFAYRREDFLRHYHKRSNVESTFAMMKAKFGDSIRSKTDVAMRNEALAKVLCHNVVVLIHEMYELGIEPSFWNESGPTTCAELPPAQR